MMIYLFIFLLVAFATPYFISPKNKKTIWIATMFLPIILVFLFVFFTISTSTSSRPYLYGGMMLSNTILPAIISAIVIYFQLHKKFKNHDNFKSSKLLIGTLLLTLLLSVIQCSIGAEKEEINSTEKKITTNTQDNRAPIRETALILQKQLPIEVSPGSILYKIAYDESSNEFITYRKEMDIDKDDYSQEELKEMEYMIKSQLLDMSKGNAKNQYLLNANTSLSFVYKDKNNKLLFKFSFTPNEYR